MIYNYRDRTGKFFEREITVYSGYQKYLLLEAAKSRAVRIKRVSYDRKSITYLLYSSFSSYLREAVNEYFYNVKADKQSGYMYSKDYYKSHPSKRRR